LSNFFLFCFHNSFGYDFNMIMERYQSPSKLFSKPAILSSYVVLSLCGWFLGIFFCFGSKITYLQLQANSDGAHRLAITCILACFVLVLLFGVLSWFFRKKPNLFILLTLLGAATLGIMMVTLGYITEFDRTIEEKGLLGQWRVMKHSLPSTQQTSRWQKPVFETNQGPGLVAPIPDSDDIIILDRRTIARKTSNGKYPWSRPRLGLFPASISINNDTIFYLGPGPDFEDDVIISSIDIISGQERWVFHCLGNTVSWPIIKDNLFTVSTHRKSSTAVYLFDWSKTSLIWSTRIDQVSQLPPRFSPAGIEIAVKNQLILLDQDTGKVLQIREACEKYEQNGVICTPEGIIDFNHGRASWPKENK
jgi:hypothetical protein